MESSGRQLSKNTKYAIVHALLGKKVRYQAVEEVRIIFKMFQIFRMILNQQSAKITLKRMPASKKKSLISLTNWPYPSLPLARSVQI